MIFWMDKCNIKTNSRTIIMIRDTDTLAILQENSPLLDNGVEKYFDYIVSHPSDDHSSISCFVMNHIHFCIRDENVEYEPLELCVALNYISGKYGLYINDDIIDRFPFSYDYSPMSEREKEYRSRIGEEFDKTNLICHVETFGDIRKTLDPLIEIYRGNKNISQLVVYAYTR